MKNNKGKTLMASNSIGGKHNQINKLLVDTRKDVIKMTSNPIDKSLSVAQGWQNEK